VRASAHFFRRYRVPLSYIVIHDFLHVDVRNLISIVTARPSYNHCRSGAMAQSLQVTVKTTNQILPSTPSGSRTRRIQSFHVSTHTYPYLRTHTYVPPILQQPASGPESSFTRRHEMRTKSIRTRIPVYPSSRIPCFLGRCAD
jgi:hypothetical protein